MSEIPEAVTARDVARAWRLSEDFVRDHREEFGGIKLGKHRSAPVRFPIRALTERLVGQKPERKKRAKVSRSEAHAEDRKLLRIVRARA